MLCPMEWNVMKCTIGPYDLPNNCHKTGCFLGVCSRIKTAETQAKITRHAW